MQINIPSPRRASLRLFKKKIETIKTTTTIIIIITEAENTQIKNRGIYLNTLQKALQKALQKTQVYVCTLSAEPLIKVEDWVEWCEGNKRREQR